MMELTAPQPSVATDEGFEVSPQQARLWPLLQARPHNGRRCAVELTLPGDSDIARLRHSLLDVIERHEVLRTRLQRVGALSQPLQFIRPLPAVDWNTSTAQANAVTVRLQALSGELRLTLELDADLIDGGSLLDLVGQWAAAYRDCVTDEPVLQYADYSAWRSELVAEDGAGRLFWNDRLKAGDAPRLPLRSGVTQPVENATFARHRLNTDGELHSAITMLARQTGSETGIVLLGAWLALLHRHIDSDVLLAGVEWPHGQADLDGALGLFVEPLPLLVHNAGSVSFVELCRQLAAEADQLADHRNSFPSAVAPLLRLGFRYLVDVNRNQRQAAAWSVQSLVLPVLATLQLSVEHIEGRLDLAVNYSEAIYTPAAISCLAAQWRNLILSAAQDPQRKLAELTLLGDDERSLLAHWSAADTLSLEQARQYQNMAQRSHLGSSFEAAVDEHTDAPAVADSQGELSYAELHRQSTWLARHLVDQGFQAGQIVAHCLPRDRRAVVALLAILKAGGVYLPVDPNYPASRIDHLLQDSQACWLLCTSSILPSLPNERDPRFNLIQLDELGESEAHEGLPGANVDASSTAYLIYTSGSTGLPKGVPISHQAALHSLAARLAYYPERVERYLLLSSFAFDSSIAGLFWSLAQGACLHIADAGQQKDTQAVAELIDRHSVSHVLAVPSLHGLLLEQLPNAISPLKAVIVAGERCSAALVRRHHHTLPQVALYNEYGPTEAAVWCTVQRCDPQDAQLDLAGTPIGRPIPGARVWVLDERLRPLPAGLIGEICVGGPGLSSGYLHRPELTQEKFVYGPATGGERLYRTGDYGYFDENGRLFFQGRQDGQLKIRGHRVELGEIEQVLNRVLPNAQAVVLAEETEHGPLLRAFAATEADIDVASVLAGLAHVLPEYMIPAELQVLPQFPLTANGKIDAKALLARERKTTRPAYRPPAAGAGQLLAALWEELLQLEDIGLDDNFFALGGHSLLVAQLVYRMQQVFGKNVPVATVFQYPLLGQLLTHLQLGVDGPLVPLRHGQGATHLICCDPGDALHYYLPLARALPMAVSVWGLALPVAETPETKTLSDLALHYVQQIQRQNFDGPLWLCGWSMGGLLALETARQLELLGDNVAGVIVLDSTFRLNNDSLGLDALLDLVRQELTPESCHRFDALAGHYRSELGNAVEGLPKTRQLDFALLQWRRRHRLNTQAPEAVVERELRSMTRARAWIDAHRILAPRAPVHGFWAEQTLQREPQLPQEWQSAYLQGLLHAILPGDHESLMHSAALQQRLIALLV